MASSWGTSWDASWGNSWGALTAGQSAQLDGLPVTSAQGALTPNIEVTLFGQAATTTQGALGTSVDGSRILGGLRATLQSGRLNDYGSLAQTGDVWARTEAADLFVSAAPEERVHRSADDSLSSSMVAVELHKTQDTDEAVVQDAESDAFVLVLLPVLYYTSETENLTATTQIDMLFVTEPDTQIEGVTTVKDLIAA